MNDPAVLSTLRTLVAGPSGDPASTPDATSFSIGFLAALGAKELQDQAAGAERQAAKQAKSQPSPVQMGQGTLGQADQLVTLARFAQSGLLPQLMSGGTPNPLMAAPAPGPMGPPNPMMMAAAGQPMPPMGGPPAPMRPEVPPPMGGPAPAMTPPAGMPPGAIPPAILTALQGLMRPTAGLV